VESDCHGGYSYRIDSYSFEALGVSGDSVQYDDFKLRLSADTLLQIASLRKTYALMACSPAITHENYIVSYKITAGDTIFFGDQVFSPSSDLSDMFTPQLDQYSFYEMNEYVDMKFLSFPNLPIKTSFSIELELYDSPSNIVVKSETNPVRVY